MNNVMPVLEVKARRIGGSTYQVPLEIRAERRQTLGLRWIVLYARARSERTMQERLAGEILDACNQQGSAFKKEEGCSQDGRSEQGFRTLQVLIFRFRKHQNRCRFRFRLKSKNCINLFRKFSTMRKGGFGNASQNTP